MQERPAEKTDLQSARDRGDLVFWVSGAWTLPFLGIALWLLPPTTFARALALVVAALLAPLPVLIRMRRERKSLLARAAMAQEATEQLRMQLATVRHRTSRLREELQAADR